jgi:hypothetical protein
VQQVCIAPGAVTCVLDRLLDGEAIGTRMTLAEVVV